MPAALHEYLALKREVASAGDTLIRVGEELRADLLPAKSARQHLEDEGRFRVLVLGEFSRGKSTFINALIRAKLLPAAVTSCTATLNVLRGGPRRGATIHYRDPQRPSRTLDLEIPDPDKALRSIVTKKGEDTEAISRVDLTWPGRMEDTQVEIVDTPGVNDIDQQREEITFSFLPRADAAILLLDCQQPFNGTEKRFLTEKILGNDIRKLFFVVNKIDQLGDATKVARVLDHVRAAITEVVPGARVFGVASKPWLLAQAEGGAPATGSGFQEFEDELFAFLAKASGASKLNVPVRRLSRFGDGLQTRISDQRQRLLGDGTVIKLQIEKKKEEVRALKVARVEAERTLDVHAARLQSEVVAECQLALGRLQQRGLTALRDGSMAPDQRVDAARTVVNEESRNVVSRMRSIEAEGLARLHRALDSQVTAELAGTVSASELSGITFDTGTITLHAAAGPNVGLLGGAGAGAAALALLVGANPIGLAAIVVGGLWMFLRNNGEQEELKVRQELERRFIASIEPFRSAADRQATEMVAGMVRGTREGLRKSLDSRIAATSAELAEMEGQGTEQAGQIRGRLARIDQLEAEARTAKAVLDRVAAATEGAAWT